MPNILVVDDAPTELDALRLGAQEAIDASGGIVQVARDVATAITLLEQNHFDVVVTDLQLTPEQHNEGWDVLQYARKINAATKVIVVTGFSQPEIQAKSVALGAFEYFDKREGDVIQHTQAAIDRALAAKD